MFSLSLTLSVSLRPLSRSLSFLPPLPASLSLSVFPISPYIRPLIQNLLQIPLDPLKGSPPLWGTGRWPNRTELRRPRWGRARADALQNGVCGGVGELGARDWGLSGFMRFRGFGFRGLGFRVPKARSSERAYRVPKAPKYHYNTYLAGIWAPRVYTILLLGPFGVLGELRNHDEWM